MAADWLLLLALLLPIAYFSGWWLARRSATKNHSANLSQEYFQGLNYVLNEQPDKAIEVFTRMLELDSETVETHLALGNLFRRRGEVGRAIRIHQNLIARPTLNAEQRIQALLELGKDYMRSGLLDRAESLFNELVETGKYTNQAFRGLIDIYQQEKEWDKAIMIARRLQATTGEKLSPVIAQFYCELAVEHKAKGNDKEARDCVKRALNIDPACVRASLLEAQEAKRLGQARAAIRAYKRVEKQDAEYLPEIILPLSECYKEQRMLDELTQYLTDLTQRYEGITPLLYLADVIAERDGKEESIKFISKELEKRPSVRGVDKLLEYAIDNADGEVRESLASIKDLTASLLQDRTIYRCTQCGFDAKLLHWQCPGCKNWNTVKPIYGVVGE